MQFFGEKPARTNHKWFSGARFRVWVAVGHNAKHALSGEPAKCQRHEQNFDRDITGPRAKFGTVAFFGNDAGNLLESLTVAIFECRAGRVGEGRQARQNARPGLDRAGARGGDVENEAGRQNRCEPVGIQIFVVRHGTAPAQLKPQQKGVTAQICFHGQYSFAQNSSPEMRCAETAQAGAFDPRWGLPCRGHTGGFASNASFRVGQPVTGDKE